MKKLTDKECQAIWEGASAKNPLKLDARGLEVMDWVKRSCDMKLTKVHDRKIGIN